MTYGRRSLNQSPPFHGAPSSTPRLISITLPKALADAIEFWTTSRSKPVEDYLRSPDSLSSCGSNFCSGRGVILPSIGDCCTLMPLVLHTQDSQK